MRRRPMPAVAMTTAAGEAPIIHSEIAVRHAWAA
jgi:hypothetical protein